MDRGRIAASTEAVGCTIEGGQAAQVNILVDYGVKLLIPRP
jgi:hypothetical protein